MNLTRSVLLTTRINEDGTLLEFQWVDLREIDWDVNGQIRFVRGLSVYGEWRVEAAERPGAGVWSFGFNVSKVTDKWIIFISFLFHHFYINIFLHNISISECILNHSHTN